MMGRLLTVAWLAGALLASAGACASRPVRDGAPASAGAALGAEVGPGGGAPATVVLHTDFQAREPGPYTEAMVAGDFGRAPQSSQGLREGRARIVAEGDERFLRITYTAGTIGPADNGVRFTVRFPESYEELYLSYRVRFAEGFDFVRGGKLPGLGGGSGPSGCVDDTDGFTARMIWRAAGLAAQYMYYPEKRSRCGDDFPYGVAFRPGVWHTVEHRLVMNTPGVADGVLQTWLDGTLRVDEHTFLYRLQGADFGIDALYFSTFFGGSEASCAPPSDQVADLDDFVVSTAPTSLGGSDAPAHGAAAPRRP